jgi:hypothetical protein
MPRKRRPRPRSESLTEDADRDRIGGGPGASDANSGAGNATGAPDAETGMRAGNVVNRGNVERDRKQLFPDAPKGKSRTRGKE